MKWLNTFNKNIFIHIGSVAFVIILVVTACYYDSEEMLYPTLSSQCDTTSVGYTKSIEPMLSAYCTGCHGASANSDGGGIRFDSYDLTKQNFSAIIGDVKTGKMPKGGNKLSDCKITTLEKWKAAGMPQETVTVNSNQTTTSCDSSFVSWSKNAGAIIQQNCLTCHNTGGSTGTAIVLTDSAKTFPLIGSIVTDVDLGRMPKNLPALSACDKGILAKWQRVYQRPSGIVCDTVHVYYAKSVKPIMDYYCTSCHGVGAQVDLSDSTKVLSHIDVIVGDVTTGTMPKNSARLSNCNIAMIKKYKRLYGIDICSISPRTFTKVVKPIIDNYCISCHGSNTTTEVRLDNYANIVSNFDNSIQTIQDESMPPSPHAAVPSCQVNILNQWKTAGFPQTNSF